MRAMSSSAWVGDCDCDQADCTSATATSTPRANQLERSIQTFFHDCNPSRCGREFVEVLDVGTRCTVEALHLWIRGFDYVVFVGSVGAAAVAETEMAGGEAQRVAGENVAGPGAGVARQKHGIDAVAAVYGVGDANQLGVGWRASGIVAPAHFYLNIGKTFFGEMRF